MNKYVVMTASVGVINKCVRGTQNHADVFGIPHECRLSLRALPSITPSIDLSAMAAPITRLRQHQPNSRLSCISTLEANSLLMAS